METKIPLKDFVRDNLCFSICGLNWGLCPMKLDGHCPGCGDGDGNQSCKIAKCSIQHGKIEYCNQCQKFPRDKYEGADEYDIFITHRIGSGILKNEGNGFGRWRHPDLIGVHYPFDSYTEKLKNSLCQYGRKQKNLPILTVCLLMTAVVFVVAVFKAIKVDKVLPDRGWSQDSKTG